MLSRPVLAFVLAASFLQAPPVVRPDEEAFAAGVSEADLRRYVRELVAFGPRMGGTPSNEKSAAYLASFFKKHGLEVAIQEDPPALAHWESAWRVELEDGSVIESAWPFGFSASTGGVRTGQLLIVPDLAKAAPDAAWAGRILYTPGEVTRAYAAVVKSGHLPAAILTSAPNDPTRYIAWSRLSSLPPSAGHPVPVFAVSYTDGRSLDAAARAGRSVRVSLDATIREGRGKTVIATLRGQEADAYYLVCAHGDSDSGGPGADDNASGVATVMEIARVYAALVRSGRVPRPKYSIRFAVWGAEYRSARTFIEKEGEKLKNLKGVINFDETGTGAERDAIYFEGNDVPWNETLLRTFEAVAGDYAGRQGFWTEYTTNPSQGGTDSYAFLPKKYRGTGQTELEIPSTTIYTAAWDKLAELDQTPGWESKGTPDPKKLKIDYSLYYHSSGDTPENTTEREPQNMVRAVKVTGLTLLRLNR
ncbi:MAG TPA: M28 family peptidase [Vicinamibacterales bacterium]|nr:M28 family peptidase [Vicinamibacterales bacterium]